MAEQYIYEHDDVYTTAGQTREYWRSVGMVASGYSKLDLMGSFAQLRVGGDWPRAVNLWEHDWSRLAKQIEDQDSGGAAPNEDFVEWVRRSASQRTGGFGRLMIAGAGSPSLAELKLNPIHRPCLVQLDIRMRPDAQEDSMRWISEQCVGTTAMGDWAAMMWFSCLHEPRLFVYYGGSTWDGITDLAAALPLPDPAWNAQIETACLEAWPGSAYLT